MKRKRFLIAGIVVVVALAVTFGVLCSQPSGTGTLKLYLADAPINLDNVTGVYITVNEIQYHLNNQWQTATGFTGPQTYNLLELTGGNSTLLGNLTLPSGNYTQIRFMLNIPTEGSQPTNPGCYIRFADNSTEPLFVPSGNETGYKGIGQFTVPAGGTVEVTAEFNVEQAVVVTNSRYILQPTITMTLAVNTQGGGIY
jgi:hypothetical protein